MSRNIDSLSRLNHGADAKARRTRAKKNKVQV